MLDDLSKNVKKFRNTSGINHIIATKKIIRASSEIVYPFSEEEIESMPVLKKLIKDGILIEINQSELKENKSENLADNLTDDALKHLENKNIFYYGQSGKNSEPHGEEKEIVDKTAKKEYKSGVETWWSSPVLDAGGYGKMSREIILQLYKMGVKVQADIMKQDNTRNTLPASPPLKEMLTNVVDHMAPAVYNCMPQKTFFRPGKKILYTMMECEGVESGFMKRCNEADEVWLPSNFNMESFQRDGLKKPCYHIPLGVNPDLYKPLDLTEEDRKKISVKTRSFVFLSVFGWSLRKGVDVLFKAYLEEFSDKDDVTLLVVSRWWGHSDQKNTQVIKDDIMKYIDKYCKNKSSVPNIVHIGQVIPEEYMPVVYNMSNCFVLPSRGEGMNLCGLEAGAVGIPVIMTRCSGQLDYLNDDNSFLVDIEGYGENQEVASASSFYKKQKFAILGQTAVDQLKEKMRYVCENESDAKEKAKILQADVLNEFTWEMSAAKCLDRLKS